MYNMCICVRPHCSLTRLNDSANATLVYKDMIFLSFSFFFSAQKANHARLDYQSMQSPPFRPYFLASNLAASRSRHRGHKVLLGHLSPVVPPRPRHPGCAALSRSIKGLISLLKVHSLRIDIRENGVKYLAVYIFTRARRLGTAAFKHCKK